MCKILKFGSFVHYESRTVQKALLQSNEKVATMKNTDDFHYKGKPLHTTTKLAPFTISKAEWDTKEDTGKSMKNAAVCQKACVRLKRRRTVSP